MKLREISKKEFEDFCDDVQEKNIFQSKEWAEVKRRFGYHTYFVGLDQSGKIRAAAMLLSTETKMLKKRIFYCPRGYMIYYRDLELLRAFTKGITEFAKEKNAIYLRISPFVSLKDRDYLGNIVEGGMNNQKCVDNLLELGYLPVDKILYTDPRWLYKIDLSGKNNDELLSSFSDDAQNIIKRNESIGIKTRELSIEELPTFLDVLKLDKTKIDYLECKDNIKDIYEVLKKNKMISVNVVELDIDKFMENTTQSIENALGDESLTEQLQKQLETVQNLQYKYGHSIMIGGACSFIYKNKMSTLCHVFSNQFTNYSPIYSMFYDLIKLAKKRSCDAFYMYGIDDNFTTNSLFNCYKNFHGQVVELIGEYDLVFDEFSYNREMKKLLKEKEASK